MGRDFFVRLRLTDGDADFDSFDSFWMVRLRLTWAKWGRGLCGLILISDYDSTDLYDGHDFKYSVQFG
jgi:hypothetical protein